MKKIAVLVLLAVLGTSLFALAACGSSGTSAAAGDGTTTTVQADRTFTMTELAQYDGKNGQPAYVAVDGVVYDVTASKFWQGGVHSNCNLGAVAGQDLSSVIAQAPPSMRSLLQRMPVVGHLGQ